MTLLRTVLGAFFTALVAAAFAISFAAIIYTGDLGQFLEHGIGLTLLGAAIISTVGALTLSFRGSILGPQDVPAILISTSAAALVSGTQLPSDVRFATTACLIATCTVSAGIVSALVGQLKLAHISRFFPYPVLAGFLAATGLLLLMAGLDIAMSTLDAAGAGSYVTKQALIRWGAVVVLAILMVAAIRLFDGFLVMPLTLMLALAGLYAFYAVLGLSFDDLRAEGLLLGPFEGGGFWQSIDPNIVTQADWGLIISQAPLILSVSAATLIGATLNASGLELQLKRDFEINQEVMSSGFANIISGLAGGIPGYHVVGETVLANRLGLAGALAGLSSAAGCAVLLFGGAGLLALFPTAFFAAVIAFLGIDLLYTWFWEERKRFDWSDYAIVALIPIVAVAFGFLTAIAVGLMMACAFFVLACARVDIVRFQSDVSKRRSRVERPIAEMETLAATGNSAIIAELSGFLFFGTSQTLRDKILALLEENPNAKWLLLDFKRVSGVDLSTQHAMTRVATDCATRGVSLVLTSIGEHIIRELDNADVAYSAYTSLDAGIEQIEDVLIRNAASNPATIKSLFDNLIDHFDEEGFGEYAEPLTLEAGQTVVEQGVNSQDIYVLRSGRLRITAEADDATELVLAHIRAGTVVGEMAYYTDGARSAKIVATEQSSLICFKMEHFASLESERPELAALFHKLIARAMARRLNRTTRLIHDLEV